MKKAITSIIILVSVIFGASALTHTFTIWLIAEQRAEPNTYMIAHEGLLKDKVVLTKSLDGNKVTEGFELIRVSGNRASDVTVKATPFRAADGSVVSDKPVITVDGNDYPETVTLPAENRAEIPFSITWNTLSRTTAQAVVTVTTTAR